MALLSGDLSGITCLVIARRTLYAKDANPTMPTRVPGGNTPRNPPVRVKLVRKYGVLSPPSSPTMVAGPLYITYEVLRTAVTSFYEVHTYGGT